MISKRKKLTVFLLIKIILIIIYKLLDQGKTFLDGIGAVSPLYWIALIFGLFVVLYAVGIRCVNCSKPQVFTGTSIFSGVGHQKIVLVMVRVFLVLIKMVERAEKYNKALVHENH